MKSILTLFLFVVFCAPAAFPQETAADDQKKADEVIKSAIARLGGQRYLNATSIVSEGKLSITQDQKIVSFQSFVDVIVYPDKERTDFSERGVKTVQVNTGDDGWIYQEFLEKFGDQDEKQLAGFKTSLRTHYDFLLRGNWKGKAELSYEGRRQASLGKRNDVLKLEFEDDFWVEYEFDDEGFPMKTVYSSPNAEGAIVPEENRYAQFILIDGIFFPFIVDHFSDGKRTYRVNYTEVRFNKRIPDSVFVKPEEAKKIKKMKL